MNSEIRWFPLDQRALYILYCTEWTTCASFFDAPGYGTQTDQRHFRLECEPGRGRSSGAERNRVGPNGADWSQLRDWQGGWEGHISGSTPCSNRPTKLAQVVHWAFRLNREPSLEQQKKSPSQSAQGIGFKDVLCARQLGLLTVHLVAAHKPGIPLNRIWKPVKVRRILSSLASIRWRIILRTDSTWLEKSWTVHLTNFPRPSPKPLLPFLMVTTRRELWTTITYIRK